MCASLLVLKWLLLSLQMQEKTNHGWHLVATCRTILQTILLMPCCLEFIHHRFLTIPVSYVSLHRNWTGHCVLNQIGLVCATDLWTSKTILLSDNLLFLFQEWLCWSISNMNNHRALLIPWSILWLVVNCLCMINQRIRYLSFTGIKQIEGKVKR